VLSALCPRGPGASPCPVPRPVEARQQLVEVRRATLDVLDHRVPVDGPLSAEERTCQLATQGTIPLEACATASPVLQPRPPLYTPTELETIRLVNAGQLPAGTLDGPTSLIKRLANEGQVPREAAYGLTPC
jgi:hypothetical protein